MANLICVSEWLEIEPDQSTFSERRCDLRHAVAARGELAGQPLVLSNLSGTGFRALHPAGELGVGQVCRIRLQLGPQELQARARLVWSRPFGGDGDDGGFGFVGLSEEQSAALQSYLEALTLQT